MSQSALHHRDVSHNQFGNNATINQGDTHYHVSYQRPARAEGAIHVIPFPRNEDVVHRQDLVDKLDKLLPQASKQTATSNSAALWGLGGSGKTQIALDYAYRRGEDCECSVFWVHADSEAAFIHDYKRIAKKFGIDKTLEGEELLETVRDSIASEPLWVLIVDNADDLSLFGIGKTTEGDGLYSYIPIGPKGTVLWTSRDEQIAGTLVNIQRSIEVTSMTTAEAITLLETTRNEKANPKDLDNVMKLLEELQWFPLAILQAGAYMRRMLITTEGYLSLLGQSKRRLEALKQGNEWNRHRRSEMPSSVLETWWVTMERIQIENEMAYQILHVVAYLDNQLPHELISAITKYSSEDVTEQLDELGTGQLEEPNVRAAIMRLKEFSFLKFRLVEDGDEQSYEMHKLVQEATRYKLSIRGPDNQTIEEHPGQSTLKQPERAGEAHYSGIALQVISVLFPNSEQVSWGKCEKYLSHAIKVGDWAEICGKQIETSSFLSRVSKYLYDQGRWTEKEAVDDRALRLMQTKLGQNHPLTTRTMSNLAITYCGQGWYEKAETLSKEVLRLERGMFHDQHPDIIRSMSSLAVIYHKQGHYDKAEGLATEVLKLRQQVLGEKHPDTIRSMANLASIYFEQRRYDEDEKLSAKVLELRKEVLGENHPETIQSLANLAVTYNSRGHYDKAETLKLEALNLQIKMLGEKHPDTIRSMASLAATYYKQGRYKEDEEISVKALELRREIFGENHPDTLQSMQDVAVALSCQGRYSDAVRLTQECLDKREAILGLDHRLTQLSAKFLRKWESQEKEAREAKKMKEAKESKAIKGIRKWFKSKR
ncbi:hypothetical protein TARUN_3344 [Trichoderma arundinaceum]|uniref:Uncharacterized protein n=1 Tax=Trichoderma arundinaceum TaxID=490622 RepID=A0A395NSE7_TRIAR|nr:hypothetical protein TARUN_3344 [Trichoderma arundinaceum]